MIRPNESIQRLKNDVAAHEITEQAVHYYGSDSKEHGTDIEKLLAYVEQLETKTLLADDHFGMRANGLRYLKGERGRGYTVMRQQMAGHLQELAEKYYAGEITIVDEFLQLYCIGVEQRKFIAQKKENHAT